MLQIDKLRAAAGPVSSDQTGSQFGLYRKHCAHCHGLSGDGAGPTSVFLEPYPRDFRRGIFKYKSTPGPLAPPTDDDLVRAIRNGSPGTGMPAFNLLTDAELAALLDYVKYLSIRGEVERALIFESIDQLEDEYDRLVDLSLRDKDPEEFAEQMKPIIGLVRGVVSAGWTRRQVTPVPPPPAGWGSADSIRRGQDIVRGQCSQLRQVSWPGGSRRRADDRLRRLGSRNRGPPESRRGQAVLGRRGPGPAAGPRRNLEHGIYRGGGRPEDLYRRILNGISGTPMPATRCVRPTPNPTTSG